MNSFMVISVPSFFTELISNLEKGIKLKKGLPSLKNAFVDVAKKTYYWDQKFFPVLNQLSPLDQTKWSRPFNR